MRLATTLWRLAALAGCAFVPLCTPLVAAAETTPPTPAPLPAGCFEFPIVIISPVDKPFPSKGCKQPDGPGENCLKAPTEVDLEVIDRRDASGAPLNNCISDNTTALHRATAKYRGQSSLGFSKHQYSVSLHEEAPLLGFPSEKTFVFNGPHIDGSLIRNHMAHWLFRATGRYSPLTRFMIVYQRNVATKDVHYLGVYLALEKITYGPKRVALAPLTNQCNASQLNGGWAWQLNPLNYAVYSPNVVKDKYYYMFGAGERPVLMYPKAKDMTQTIRDYFVNTSTGPLPQLYRSLYDKMTDPDDLERHIDVGSFIDYFLHSEMSQNTDAFRRSTYFFKDRDQPINAGPVWDFNLAYGTGSNQADWLHKNHFLWGRMFVNYKYTALTIQRWRSLRATVWSDDALDAFIDEAVAPFKRQFQTCFHWYSGLVPCANVQVEGTYEANVERVRMSVKSRAKWMDENIIKFYGKIHKSAWAQAIDIPNYNCAADGEDDGCLTNPDKYINAVTFPAVRKPYSGPACSNPQPQEQPSIDPCWMSSGTDPRFCSGNGYCGMGPGAKCSCYPGKLAPTCAEDEATAAKAFVVQPSATVNAQWGKVTYFALFVGVVVVALAVAQRRRYPGSATKDERAHIMPKTH